MSDAVCARPGCRKSMPPRKSTKGKVPKYCSRSCNNLASRERIARNRREGGDLIKDIFIGLSQHDKDLLMIMAKAMEHRIGAESTRARYKN